jgi:hypothetical protein
MSSAWFNGFRTDFSRALTHHAGLRSARYGCDSELRLDLALYGDWSARIGKQITGSPTIHPEPIHASRTAEFWNPKTRVPGCFNPAAVRSILSLTFKRTEMISAGRSKAQIIESIRVGFDNKELPAPELARCAI